MKVKYFLLLAAIMLIGCDSNSIDFSDEKDKEAVNQVLLLQVDYTSNKFEGGKEFKFTTKTDDFTIINEYKAPGDFGSVKLLYKELNEPLFEGTIIWMGTGEMIYPEKLESASKFKVTLTEDFVYPGKGFEPIITPGNPEYKEEDLLKVWVKIQYLIKVREYLKSNPHQHVKIFLYTPSVGVGDPLTWKWLIFLKK